MKAAPLACAVLAAAAIQAAPAAVRHVAARTRTWTNVATVAPDGGYVLGNPNAKTRLIEYVSLTCPHCAVFAAAGWPGLEPYIRTGGLALEVRTAVRDRFDLAATLLARCQGPQRYFDTAALIFAHQQEWMAKASAWDATAPDPSTQPPADALIQSAQGAGLDTLLAARGYTPASIRACLSDKAAVAAVTAMASEAWEQRKIAGTPAFMINDVAIDVHDWPSLQPFVADAVK